MRSSGVHNSSPTEQRPDLRLRTAHRGCGCDKPFSRRCRGHTSHRGRLRSNLSKLDLQRLLDDPNQLAPNLNSYINGFSPNIRAIMERFDFGAQIVRMA